MLSRTYISKPTPNSPSTTETPMLGGTHINAPFLRTSRLSYGPKRDSTTNIIGRSSWTPASRLFTPTISPRFGHQLQRFRIFFSHWLNTMVLHSTLASALFARTSPSSLGYNNSRTAPTSPHASPSGKLTTRIDPLLAPPLLSLLSRPRSTLGPAEPVCDIPFPHSTRCTRTT